MTSKMTNDEMQDKLLLDRKSINRVVWGNILGNLHNGIGSLTQASCTTDSLSTFTGASKLSLPIVLLATVTCHLLSTHPFILPSSCLLHLVVYTFLFRMVAFNSSPAVPSSPSSPAVLLALPRSHLSSYLILFYLSYSTYSSMSRHMLHRSQHVQDAMSDDTKSATQPGRLVWEPHSRWRNTLVLKENTTMV